MRALLSALSVAAVAAACVWTVVLPPSAALLRAAPSEVAPGAFPKAATDPAGHAVVLAAPPKRIVSLSLAADETLVALVAPARIAGLTRYVDDPTVSALAGKAPKGPARASGEPEQLLSLRPDLVIASSFTRPEAIALVEGAGVPVIGMGTLGSFDAIVASILMMGNAVDESAQAHALAGGLEARVRAVEARGEAPSARRRVLFWDGGFTYGAGTLEDTMVRLAGGQNVAADLQGAVGLTEEAAMALRPDLIVVPIAGERVQWRSPDLVGRSAIWSAVPCVQRGEVYGVPRAWVGSVSLEAVRALESLSDILRGAPGGGT